MAIDEVSADSIKTIDDLVAVQVSFDASVASAALDEGVYDLAATENCYIKVASSPTATVATGYYLPAGVVIRLFIQDTYKVAAIKQTGGSAGLLNIHAVDNVD